MTDTKIDSKSSWGPLQWIEDSKQDAPDEQTQPGEYNMSLKEKLTHNILVPAGLVATVACLSMGLVNLKRGDRHRQQFYMRGRITAQFFTFVAMLTGVYMTNKSKAKRGLPTK